MSYCVVDNTKYIHTQSHPYVLLQPALCGSASFYCVVFYLVLCMTNNANPPDSEWAYSLPICTSKQKCLFIYEALAACEIWTMNKQFLPRRLGSWLVVMLQGYMRVGSVTQDGHTGHWSHWSLLAWVSWHCGVEVGSSLAESRGQQAARPLSWQPSLATPAPAPPGEDDIPHK